eukprot:jgi/Astpho2/5583/Aster-02839
MISGLMQIAFAGCAILGALVLYKVFAGNKSLDSAIRDTQGQVTGKAKELKGQVRGAVNENKAL